MSEELKRWQEIAKHATSGDQVWDILMAWKKSEDELQSALIQAQGAIQYQGMEINTLREQLDIAVKLLKNLKPILDKLGYGIGDTLTKIEKGGKE